MGNVRAFPAGSGVLAGNVRAFPAGSGVLAGNVRAISVKSAVFRSDSAVFAVFPEKPQLLSRILRFDLVTVETGNSSANRCVRQSAIRNIRMVIGAHVPRKKARPQGLILEGPKGCFDTHDDLRKREWELEFFGGEVRGSAVCGKMCGGIISGGMTIKQARGSGGSKTVAGKVVGSNSRMKHHKAKNVTALRKYLRENDYI